MPEDMLYGLLDSEAKPLPAWERTLQRIKYWSAGDKRIGWYADRGENPHYTEELVVEEIVWRVIGTELPTDEFGEGPFRTTVPKEFIKALTTLKEKAFFDVHRCSIDKAIDWVKRTYNV